MYEFVKQCIDRVNSGPCMQTREKEADNQLQQCYLWRVSFFGKITECHVLSWQSMPELEEATGRGGSRSGGSRVDTARPARGRTC